MTRVAHGSNSFWGPEYRVIGGGIIFGDGDDIVRASTGRFCWNCGYLLLFVDLPTMLEKRAKMSPLK